MFTPLLASTCTGTVEFRSVITPLRNLRTATNYYQAFCSNIDFKNQIVHCIADSDHKFSIPYDRLAIAVGAKSNTFGIPGVGEHAFFLKEIEDARRIRHRILDNFERAKWPGIDEKQQREILHFSIVGGGPTGIEFAAELNDLIVEDLGKIYPELIPLVTITVYDVAQRILGSFDQQLAEFAMKRFARSGIKIATDTRIKKVEEGAIHLADGSRIGTGMVVWATGLTASPLIKKLGESLQMDDRRFRLQTNEYLQAFDSDGQVLSNVYALGDCASIRDQELPCTAQVALQKAQYLTSVLNTPLSGKPPAPFIFANHGMMAYIGGWNAIADLQAGNRHWPGSGRLAWILWRSAYFVMTVSWRNRVLIPMYWFLAWLFGRDISRI